MELIIPANCFIPFLRRFRNAECAAFLREPNSPGKPVIEEMLNAGNSFAVLPQTGSIRRCECRRDSELCRLIFFDSSVCLKDVAPAWIGAETGRGFK